MSKVTRNGVSSELNPHVENNLYQNLFQRLMRFCYKLKNINFILTF